MVNRYAPWRYILLILVNVIGAVFAAPHLYPEDPALQISNRVNLIDETELGNIKSVLDNEGIDYRGHGFRVQRRPHMTQARKRLAAASWQQVCQAVRHPHRQIR